MRWYGRAPASPSLTREKLDKVLGCPVVMRAHRDDDLGNYLVCSRAFEVQGGLGAPPKRAWADVGVVSQRRLFEQILNNWTW